MGVSLDDFNNPFGLDDLKLAYRMTGMSIILNFEYYNVGGYIHSRSLYLTAQSSLGMPTEPYHGTLASSSSFHSM